MKNDFRVSIKWHFHRIFMNSGTSVPVSMRRIREVRGTEFITLPRFVPLSDALKSILNLELVGPFEILDGALKECTTSPNMHLHYRYFYDTPEFMTVIRTIDTPSQFHIGYYRCVFTDSLSAPWRLKPFLSLEIHRMNCHRLSLQMMPMPTIVSNCAARISLLQSSEFRTMCLF